MSKVICKCFNVTDEDIIASIKKGNTTIDKVSSHTNAATKCKFCKRKINKVIKRELKLN